MNYLLFITYLLFFSWLVTRVRFFTDSGLTRPALVMLFLLKVMAGIFYGWMGVYYGTTAQMVDTWHFHEQGKIEYQILWDHPAEYFSNLFVSNYPHGYDGFFASSDSYWNDLKSNIFIKFVSILHIFSFENYYINVIFYSFLSFFGPIALFRVLRNSFPNQSKALTIGVFLIPSFLYWCSGLHKDGLLFLGITLIIYHTWQLLNKNQLSAKNIAGLFLGVLLIFLMRNFLLVVLTPAWIAWLIASRVPVKPWKVFGVAYIIFILLFFNLRYIHPGLDLPQTVVSKQQAFLKLHGYSNIAITELEPTAASFLKLTPQAISLSSLRPYPSDIRHLPSLFAAVETIVLLLLLVLALLFALPRKETSDPIHFFLLFFSLSLLLVIGFSVNNLGAIVRYRSIVLPLLVAPALASTNWKRILTIVTNGKNRTTNPI